MKKMIFFLFFSLISCSIVAQGPSKKCPTCGLSIAKCQYRGKHPKNTQNTSSQQNSQSSVKRCDICNLPLSQCDYGGKHPYCETCGKLKERCEFKGNHPAQQTQAATQSSLATASKPTTGTANGHEWIDLGLPSGTKWATMNVGASSPSDYGNYYAWGETSTKSSYTWENLKYRTSGDSYDNVKFSKYVTNSQYGSADGKEGLDPGDDAAYVNWGNGWRMPSRAQQDELREKCKWTWTSMGGHNGYKVVGPNGNSLFLPAAGYRGGSELYFVGSNGSYSSRTLDTSLGNDAYCLYFDSSEVDWGSGNRRYGRSVRPVLAP